MTGRGRSIMRGGRARRGDRSRDCRVRTRVLLRPFTLLEMMVALLIFTFVVLTLFTFSQQVAHSWERLQREQRRFSELLVLDRALDTILSNAVPFLWPDEENETVPVFVGEDRRLRVAYLHATATGETCALRFLELELDGDSRLMAYYTDRPFLELDPDDEAVRNCVLARDVAAVEFRYADWDDVSGDSWPDGLLWVDEWEPERVELPLGILVTVRWNDGRTESWLRRTSGSGYRERPGKWQPWKEPAIE